MRLILFKETIKVLVSHIPRFITSSALRGLDDSLKENLSLCFKEVVFRLWEFFTCLSNLNLSYPYKFSFSQSFHSKFRTRLKHFILTP